MRLLIAVLLLIGLSGCSGDDDAPVDPPGSERHGPYRLVPPGTQVQLDGRRPFASREGFNQTTDPAMLQNTGLYLEPLPGFEEESVLAARIFDEPIAISQEWRSAEGTIVVSSNTLEADNTPIDIVLESGGAIDETRAATVGGHEAVFVVPARGAPPGIGSVRVALGDHEIVLGSTDLPFDRLVEIAEQLTTIDRD